VRNALQAAAFDVSWVPCRPVRGREGETDSRGRLAGFVFSDKIDE
jgi:hypothetical protein